MRGSQLSDVSGKGGLSSSTISPLAQPQNPPDHAAAPCNRTEHVGQAPLGRIAEKRLEAGRQTERQQVGSPRPHSSPGPAQSRAPQVKDHRRGAASRLGHQNVTPPNT